MIADSEEIPAPSPLPKIGRKRKPRPDHCLNCGIPATGKFCAECGQEIKDHSVALGPLLSEGLSELASWDSKLLRTLVPLLFRPGFLTNQYNTGKRVPYLSPVKLYLTLSVLFFLLLSWTHPAAKFVQAYPGAIKIDSDGSKPARLEAVHAHSRTAFERAMERGAARANQSPQMLIASLLSGIPKMMFFLLPLFAATLKLRVVYKQSWPATLWKFSLLGLGYVTLLSLCIGGTLLVALWLL